MPRVRPLLLRTTRYTCCLLFLVPVSPVVHGQPLTTASAIANLQRDVPVLMEKADIPGMSVALIRNGALAWTQTFGVLNTDTHKPATASSVFQAASLSKPVFAYGVLKLADRGLLDLDSPLNKYLGNNYGVVDPRIAQITARYVLSHRSGFPNWRDNDHTDTLLIHFTPGTQFSYSGEGMVYLGKVVEKITGQSLEDYLQQAVLQPLEMTSSSYLWQDRYDSLKTWDHDGLGHPSGRWAPKGGHAEAVRNGANVAASLSTNAADYAKFVLALLNGTGLKKFTWEQMQTPQIRVDPKYPALAWGLGIGLETMPEGLYLWHWGDNGDAKAYVTIFMPGKNGVVYFANSANGLSITREILADALGGTHPAPDHLDYESYHSPARSLLKGIVAGNAAAALDNYRHTRSEDSTLRIGEDAMNNVGYALLRMKRLADAVAVFRQNVTDFPGSWNAWDSYGEALLNDGRKDAAINAYQRSLAINPANKNAAEVLKRMKQ